MSTPYGPPGSEEPTQRRQQPPGQVYPQQPYPGYGQQQGYEQWQQGYEQWQQGYQASGMQPDPGYYGGYYGQPDEGGPAKKAALRWILSGVGGVVVGVILVLGFVTPGLFTTTVFDQDAVQQGVQRILSDEYGQTTQSVSCPADQEVQTGSTFTCQATIDGEQRDVTITVKTEAGLYEVARPS